MDVKDLEALVTRQLEDNNKLLQENNFLLRQIMEQNYLIFTITQKNIGYYGYHWLWGESGEVKKLRQELDTLYQQVMK